MVGSLQRKPFRFAALVQDPSDYYNQVTNSQPSLINFETRRRALPDNIIIPAAPAQGIPLVWNHEISDDDESGTETYGPPPSKKAKFLDDFSVHSLEELDAMLSEDVFTICDFLEEYAA